MWTIFVASYTHFEKTGAVVYIPLSGKATLLMCLLLENLLCPLGAMRMSMGISLFLFLRLAEILSWGFNEDMPGTGLMFKTF